MLKLVEEDAAVEFRDLQRFSSAYQKMRTCHIMLQAVPGVFPLTFPGSKVVGRSVSSLLQRLRKFGCVGSPAYASLRQKVALTGFSRQLPGDYVADASCPTQSSC